MAMEKPPPSLESIPCYHHPHRHQNMIFCPHRRRHHHHHHHHVILCPHHHDHRTNYKPLINPSFSPLPAQNPEQIRPIGALPFPNGSSLEPTAAFHEVNHSGTLVFQEQEQEGLEEVVEEEEEPIFVLTDEWREFFAKSEARRKLEKQAKKKQRS